MAITTNHFDLHSEFRETFIDGMKAAIGYAELAVKFGDDPIAEIKKAVEKWETKD